MRGGRFISRHAKHFFVHARLRKVFGSSALLTSLSDTLPRNSIHRLGPTNHHQVIVLIAGRTRYLNSLLVGTGCNNLSIRVTTIVNGRSALHSLIRHFSVPFRLMDRRKLDHGRRSRGVTSTVSTCRPSCIILTGCVQMLAPRFITHFPGGVVGVRRSFLPTFVNTHPCRRTCRHNIGVVNTATRCIGSGLSRNPVVVRSIVRISRACATRSVVHTNHSIRGGILDHTLCGMLTRHIFICNGQAVVLWSPTGVANCLWSIASRGCTADSFFSAWRFATTHRLV